MIARIYVLPVIRIEREVCCDGANGVDATRAGQQEFCRSDEPRPAPGSRPQLIVDNAARHRRVEPWLGA